MIDEREEVVGYEMHECWILERAGFRMLGDMFGNYEGQQYSTLSETSWPKPAVM